MNLVIKFVRSIDARYYLISSHILLMLNCLFFFGLQRSAEQMLFGFGVAVAVEALLFYTVERYTKRPFFDRFISAIAVTSGLIILLRSHLWWFYGFSAAVAVFSRYLLIHSRQGHIFNPSNFAIIFCLAFLPFTSFAAWPDEFNGNLYSMLHVLALGGLTAFAAKRLSVSVGYFLGAAVFATILSKFQLLPFIFWAGPEIGTFTLIFMLLMITDPATTPRSWKAQIAFGFCVCGVNFILRYNEILYSHFIALYVVALIRGGYIISKQYRSASLQAEPAH